MRHNLKLVHKKVLQVLCTTSQTDRDTNSKERYLNRNREKSTKNRLENGHLSDIMTGMKSN